jgi:hypothetical protein
LVLRKRLRPHSTQVVVAVLPFPFDAWELP